MTEKKVVLIDRIKRTPTIESFRFARTEKIDFLPGQFLQVIFDEKDRNNKELNKYLSFSSAPTKQYIEVTKRISESKFSKKLTSLNINDSALLKAPMGDRVFKEEYKKIAFLIGGIGITPVISILEYIVEKKLSTDAVLFYSNRREADIAFRQELDYWRGANKNIKVFYTLTEYQPVESSYIFGRIDKDLVARELKDYAERIIFIFGPPKMVEAMQTLCLEIGCPKENLRVEFFLGY